MRRISIGLLISTLVAASACGDSGSKAVADPGAGDAVVTDIADFDAPSNPFDAPADIPSDPGKKDVFAPVDIGPRDPGPIDPGPTDPGQPLDAPATDEAPSDVPATDPGEDAVTTDPGGPVACNFDYEFAPWIQPLLFGPSPVIASVAVDPKVPAAVSHSEPLPPSTRIVHLPGARDDLVMPDYPDNMPVFERALDWDGGTRCYELPSGPANLTEAEAFDVYRKVAETTVGRLFDVTPGRRTVVGLRGAYPGTFAWNGNGPNRFNDTLALLWIDEAGAKQVLEFAAHTDTGAYEHGSMSSLRPNRHYRYENGWHKTYNALAIREPIDYWVRDDQNANGHWDSDRNGWLPPLHRIDFDRVGTAHNIHLASVNAPLSGADVGQWSAGCQNIPGLASWTRFITNAWTGMGDEVDYFLVDVRDIDPEAWAPCAKADGTHACPYRIDAFPYTATGDTTGGEDGLPLYNCAPTTDESGPERVYVLHTTGPGTLRATVDDVAGEGPDVDVHILMADDPNSCLVRDNVTAEIWIPTGRYLVVVDTYAGGSAPKPGAYTLNVEFVPDV